MKLLDLSFSHLPVPVQAPSQVPVIYNISR